MTCTCNCSMHISPHATLLHAHAHSAPACTRSGSPHNVLHSSSYKDTCLSAWLPSCYCHILECQDDILVTTYLYYADTLYMPTNQLVDLRQWMPMHLPSSIKEGLPRTPGSFFDRCNTSLVPRLRGNKATYILTCDQIITVMSPCAAAG